MGSSSYLTPGSDIFVVPDGVIQVTVECWGGAGGNQFSSGGNGGYAKGDLTTTPGETLEVQVGGFGNSSSGGYPDGGGTIQASEGGGGGSSDVRQNGNTLSDRVIVGAGGGGGAYSAGSGYSGGAGGGGGPATGEGGEAGSGGNEGGGGGSQSSGGAGGAGNVDDGSDGSFGQGGEGGYQTGYISGYPSGGGGGGGYYGGGGGGGDSEQIQTGGGGGGGSNYTGGVSNTTSQRGQNSGDGEVAFNWQDPPSTPASFTQTIDSNGQVSLSWDDVGSEDQYRIEVSTDGSDWTTVATPSAGTTSYTYSATASDNVHQFRLRAERTPSGNHSAWTTTGEKATDASDATVTNVQSTEIDLSWSGADDESGYHIYRATSSGSSAGDYTEVADLAAGTTTYTDTGLTNGEQYYYRVAAYYDSTDSTLSNETTATTGLPPATDLALDTSVESEVAVSWTRNDSNTTGVWEIYRSTGESTVGSNDTTLVRTISDLSVTAWTDTGVLDGVQYHYYVRRAASDTASDSETVVGTTVLPAPSDITASVVESGRELGLSWTDNTDDGQLQRVYVRPTGDETWTLDAEISSDAQSYTTTKLLAGEQYDVRVEAVTPDATSDVVLAPAATTHINPIDAYDITLEANTLHEIDTGWEEVNNNGAYRVEVQETGDAGWTAQFSSSTTLSSCDSLADFSALTGSSLSVVDSPSDSGTAIRVDYDDSFGLHTGVRYDPGSTFALDDTLQFWFYGNADFDEIEVYVEDSNGNSDVLPRSVVTGAEYELRAYMREATGVDLSSVSLIELRWDPTFLSNWFAFDTLLTGTASVDYSNSSLTFTGVKEGEEYDVRFRSETAHVVQDPWAEASSIITLLSSPESLSVQSVSETSLDLQWDDSVTNEQTYRVQRRLDGRSDWTTLATLDPNTATYTDDTVSPNYTYDYRIQADTGHATSTSTVVTTTTPGVQNHPQQFGHGDHWTVEVDHEDGRTLTPTVVGTPVRKPTTNGLPKVEIPVRKNEKWKAPAFENAEMRVWAEGDRQPIEELRDVRHTTNPEQTVLVGIGGVELENRARVSVKSQATHAAADDLVDAETPYESNVDTPPNEAEENTTLRESTTTTDWQDATNDDTTPAFLNDADDPRQARTCWMKPVDFGTGEWNEPGGIGDDDTIAALGGDFVSIGDSVEIEFTPEYDVPPDTLKIAFRYREEFKNGPPIRFTVDGVELLTFGDEWGFGSSGGWDWHEPIDALPHGLEAGNSYTVALEVIDNGDGSPGLPPYKTQTDEQWTANVGEWVDLFNDNISVDSETVEDFGGDGDYTEGDDYELNEQNGRIKALPNGLLSDGGMYYISYDYRYSDVPIDALAAFDGTYSYTFDESDSNADGLIAGPAPFPDELPVEFTPIVPVDAVIGGRVEVDMDDTSGLQQIELSNDGGGSYPLSTTDITDGETAASYEADFDAQNQSYRTRLTLQRYGSDAGPNDYYVTEGIQRATLTGLTEQADLDRASTLLLNETQDNSVETILNDWADYGDYVWEFRMSNDGTGSVEWTRVGQRATTSDLPLVDYQTEKSNAVVERAIIYGASDNETGETWNAVYDTSRSLTRNSLIPQTEVVYDLDDRTTTYSRDVDYAIDYQAGEITALADGDFTDGTDYAIDYDYKPRGEFSTGVSDPRTEVRQAPDLITEQACEQAAQQVVQQLKNPVNTVTIVAPPQAIGFELVDALAIPGLPGATRAYQVRNVDASTEQVKAVLGRPETMDDVIKDISRQVSRAAEFN